MGSFNLIAIITILTPVLGTEAMAANPNPRTGIANDETVVLEWLHSSVEKNFRGGNKTDVYLKITLEKDRKKIETTSESVYPKKGDPAGAILKHHPIKIKFLGKDLNSIFGKFSDEENSNGNQIKMRVEVKERGRLSSRSLGTSSFFLDSTLFRKTEVKNVNGPRGKPSSQQSKNSFMTFVENNEGNLVTRNIKRGNEVNLDINIGPILNPIEVGWAILSGKLQPVKCNTHQPFGKPKK